MIPRAPLRASAVRPGARVFALAWVAAVAVATARPWAASTPGIGLEALAVAVLGFFACARPVRLGSCLEPSAARPIAFPALLAWGTPPALVIGGGCALGAALLRRPPLG